MKVKIARLSGFCFGVKRAVDLALAEAQKAGHRAIFTDGPLIHNPQAVEMLRSQGVLPLKETEGDIDGTIIIRSHGISPQRRKQIEKTNAKILDATCPKVKKVQSIIDSHAKSDYCIVIIGDAGHAEVRGLLGFAGKKGLVIQNEDELIKIPSDKKVCVVAQTTQNREDFIDLTKKISARFKGVKIFDTICDANRKRQEELRSLCHRVDAIIVVGGRESGNTKRLVEIAKSSGIPTYFGESAGDFNSSILKSYKAIGIIGGASTPDWVLNDVVNKLENAESVP